MSWTQVISISRRILRAASGYFIAIFIENHGVVKPKKRKQFEINTKTVWGKMLAVGVGVAVVGLTFGITYIIVPRHLTYNMGRMGLLLQLGMWVALMVLLVWIIRTIRRKRASGKRLPGRGEVVALFVVMAIATALIIPTIQDLFSTPVTREFDVYFKAPHGKGGMHRIDLMATSADGHTRRFTATALERIAGLPRFSRSNLPRGLYRMRITYFPHSGTRVSTEVIGISAGEK